MMTLVRGVQHVAERVALLYQMASLHIRNHLFSGHQKPCLEVDDNVFDSRIIWKHTEYFFQDFLDLFCLSESAHTLS